MDPTALSTDVAIVDFCNVVRCQTLRLSTKVWLTQNTKRARGRGKLRRSVFFVLQVDLFFRQHGFSTLAQEAV